MQGLPGFADECGRRKLAKIVKRTSRWRLNTLNLVGAISIQRADDLLKKAGIPYIFNDHAERGMSTSIRAGLNHFFSANPDGVLITVCDQPHVTSAHLTETMCCWRNSQASAVAAHYSGTVGVPAILGAKFFPLLQKLEGDRGAGEILRQLPDLTKF